jgi:hypothetical protein
LYAFGSRNLNSWDVALTTLSIQFELFNRYVCACLFAELKRFLRSTCGSCSPSQALKQSVPIISWLPTYSWRDDLPSDLIAGVTVAIMQIPQGKITCFMSLKLELDT